MQIFRYCSGTLALDHTIIMGILNITPDSFSDGGRFNTPDKALRHAMEMVEQGAGILDIGGQSTRPGHTPISAEEEWLRLEPVLKVVRARIEIPLSIDTYYKEVGRRALEYGVDILNDVSGSMKNGMPELAAQWGAGLVMMHGGGGADDRPEGLDAVAEVRRYFIEALGLAEKVGLPREQVCLDPGIGFGKSLAGDRQLAARLPEVLRGLPETAVLVGASRKRVVGACGKSPLPFEERLPGTLALHAIAQWNGARILRVHDVAAAVQAAALTDSLIKEKK